MDELTDEEGCEQDANLDAFVVVVHVRDHGHHQDLLEVDDELPVVPRVHIYLTHSPIDLNLNAFTRNGRK